MKDAFKESEEREIEALMIEADEPTRADVNKKARKKEQSKKLKKALGTARGIETMFRSAYRVQMDLTSLAEEGTLADIPPPHPVYDGGLPFPCTTN